MKIVKVTYTTRPEFSEQNQANIKKVMNDLQNLQPKGINYNVCLCPDGKTFIHTAFFESGEDEKILFNLDSFKSFQEQVRSGMPEIPPKQEILTLVGTSCDIFNS